jgi:predicted amino acid-binding ACT domain protein
MVISTGKDVTGIVYRVDLVLANNEVRAIPLAANTDA